MGAPTFRRAASALTRFIGLVVLVAAVASPVALGADSPADTLLHMEVDVIFPRNETYYVPEILPIVFAIQNFTHLPEFGNFSFVWDIMPYGDDGSVPGGILYDEGSFDIADNQGGKDPVILVSYTNVSQWYYRVEYSDRFMLQATAQWTNTSTWCRSLASLEKDWDLGHTMFSFLHPYYEVMNYTALAPNLTSAPACPALGSVVSLSRNATAANDTAQCQYSVESDEDAGAGSPCAVTVDAAAQASINSKATSMASQAALATQTTPIHTPTPTNAATGGSRNPPLGPALAAVGVVYCLVSY